MIKKPLIFQMSGFFDLKKIKSTGECARYAKNDVDYAKRVCVFSCLR
jgi:hypothetical protein